MSIHTFRLLAIVLLLATSACSSDGTTPDGGTDTGTGIDTGVSPDGGDAAPIPDGAPMPDGMQPRPPYAPTDPVGRVYAGHFLTPYAITGFDTDLLTFDPADPRPVGRPTGDLVGIPSLGVVVTTAEGNSEFEVFDADTLEPAPGSPYTTGNGAVAIAHDDVIDRLYIYCIGTEGRPSESLLTVYDTSVSPFNEVAGSPFDIDVAASAILVDPVTGRLMGHGISVAWMVEVGETGVTHVAGSPIATDDVATGMAIDPGRRRLYFGERVPGRDQLLRAYDLDDFTEITGSPVFFPGSAMGDTVVHPVTGTIFAVDFGTATLHAFTPEPFAVMDTCGTMGCTIPPTETGLALDHSRDRLFITHIPSLENPDDGPGFLTAWDVSDPAGPTELTVPGSRPRLGVFPNRLTIY